MLTNLGRNDSGPPMIRSLRVPVCAVLLGVAFAQLASAQIAPPQTKDAQIALRCKATSFARHPAGQMASTMRSMQIQRCIKNKGNFQE